MTNHHAKKGNVVLSPDPNCLIPATGCKVVSERSPADIPDRSFVALVDDELGESFE